VGNPILGSNVSGTVSSNIFSIVADPVGNVYVGGAYNGTTNFTANAAVTGPGNVTSFTLPSTTATATGGFFTKYLSTGAVSFSLGITAGANVSVNSVVLDATNSNVFVAFSYQTLLGTTMTVNTPGTTNGTGTSPSLTYPASMITTAGPPTWATGLLKLTAGGTILWGAAVDSSLQGDNDQVFGLVVDSLGNSYLSLLFSTLSTGVGAIYNGQTTSNNSGTLSLSNPAQTVTLPSTTSGTALIKFGPTGIAQWYSAVTATTTTPSNTLAIDPAGNVILAVQTTGGSASVYSGQPTATLPGAITVNNTSGATASIIVKYSTAGLTTAPVLWIAQMYGATTTLAQVYGITCGQYNSVYVTGSTTSATTISIYNGAGAGVAPSGSASTITIPGSTTAAIQQAFLAKFSSNTGAVQYVSYLPSISTTNSSLFYLAYPNPSDTDLYVAGRYFDNTVNVQTIINGNGTTSATTLPFTSGTVTWPILIRYFLGNAISAQVIPATAGTQLYDTFVDPSATNMYASGTYTSTSAITLNQANAVGGNGLPSTVVLPITPSAVPSGFWVKYA